MNLEQVGGRRGGPEAPALFSVSPYSPSPKPPDLSLEAQFKGAENLSTFLLPPAPPSVPLQVPLP